MSPKKHQALSLLILSLSLVLPLVACAETLPGAEESGQPLAPADPPAGLAFATFAGGCFWCMEPPFDTIDGVSATISGYTGGPQANPTYEQVSMGRTAHAEAVRVVFDPDTVSYEKLLDVFWRNIDPTVADRQFCDRGRQYRTAIYHHDDEQRMLAESTKGAIEASGRLPGPILTEIASAGDFFPAEDYHQDFYIKNPRRYKSYRLGCGRDQRLEELWGPASD